MAALATSASAAEAQRSPTPELALGVLVHGISPFDSARDGYYLEAAKEHHTVDVELLWRSAPIGILLHPRLTAKIQLNTDGRTSFAALGAEWRRPILRGRLYAQGGIGVAIQNGYRFTPDPFAPGLPPAEVDRRFAIFSNRIGFGSRVLFNPNASLGIHLSPRLALEAAYEHYSHGRIFSHQNPGIDNLGLRLVRTLGSR
jgi:hypothetical protein